MQIKTVRLSDMFTWLIASFRMVGNNPGRFMLASFLSLLVVFALVFIMVLALLGTAGMASFSQAGQQPDVKTLLYIYAGAAVFGILLMPPFVAGWFKLCHKLKTGQTASAFDIFSVYESSARWLKLIQYSALSLLLYIALHALYLGVCVALGVGTDGFKTMLIPDPAADPLAIFNLGTGFWIAYIGLIFFGAVLQSMFMLGFTQAALTDANAVDSLKAGIAGMLKNLPAFLAFMILALIGMILVIIAAVLVIVLAITLLSFVHQSLGFIMGAALYVVLILYIYPLMFSFQYLLWEGILGDEHSPNAEAVNESELML